MKYFRSKSFYIKFYINLYNWSFSLEIILKLLTFTFHKCHAVKKSHFCTIISVSGLFTIFGLAIFHTKNFYEKSECHTIREYPSSSCEARTVSILWPAPVAWCGVVVCFVACFLWLFLTRALRVIKAKTMLWYVKSIRYIFVE